ncbi:3,4-dihydroxy-2-butanone-4-phosphate synthase [uncultured Sulfitobacter sp.]|uniref:3,4-dihydroxy-2-butanone-4-phosphate synthase n=1 Tax=uncultured Sulfitobacter sp. TaxID=191468 RepID=UPI0025953F43|nr:3,4-dihydroxy-2-butanone-4-phosphate synthase [uncultured Sulfitobacter sp.]
MQTTRSANPKSGGNGLTNGDLAKFLSPIEEIIEDTANGRMVILVDDEGRENEGDLAIAAEKVTPEAINFMARFGRGLICMPMTRHRCEQLGLPLMVQQNASGFGTKFTLSIEATEGVTTGISAADRALTVKVAIDEDKGAVDIATPGHVFPLRARDGGVLVRAGHTEAAVDISRLAGLHPSGVICEIMKEDGTMARLPDLVAFCQQHDMKIGTISDLIAYRHKHDNLLVERDSRTVTSAYGGDWKMQIFTDEISGTDHVVLSKGDITTDAPVLVRTHAINALEDILGLGPSPADELPRAMQIIADEGRGAVLLFRDPDPRLRFENEEDDRPRTVKRTGLGSQIMASLGLHKLILLTDNPDTRYLGLDAYDLSIVGTRPITQE